MKKVINLILVLLMLCSMSVIAVSADGEYSDLTIHYYKFGESNGYDVCIIEAEGGHFVELYEVVGNYLFFSPSSPGWFNDDPIRIYAVKGAEQIYIEEACDRGLIDIDEVAKMVDGFEAPEQGISYSVVPLGDLNMNRKLEVADAVIIQKIIAKAETTSMEILCDVNKDGDINIEDVLLLQKKIAKLVP